MTGTGLTMRVGLLNFNVLEIRAVKNEQGDR